MEFKTKVHAGTGQQDLVITREFDLPVALLFKAYAEAEFLAQWMGTNVLKLESKKQGSYLLETKGKDGTVAFRAHGVIHDFIAGQKICRTFEMDGTDLGVQLEVYVFERLTENTSRLNMHVIYETAAQRDRVLKLPFTQGINWAHNRLQEVMKGNKHSS
ncbi:MAG TPA: SRPBCC domain-containing protein [Edaphocola sp.]|nr:SRPBCC domain-containing protein [Edaphocola sp.]